MVAVTFTRGWDFRPGPPSLAPGSVKLYQTYLRRIKHSPLYRPATISNFIDQIRTQSTSATSHTSTMRGVSQKRLITSSFTLVLIKNCDNRFLHRRPTDSSYSTFAYYCMIWRRSSNDLHNEKISLQWICPCFFCSHKSCTNLQALGRYIA